jgi:chromosome segregation ATPase
LATTESDKAELAEQLNQQVGENGALSTSLTDAALRIEELQLRSRALETTLADRDGRISAQEQVLERANKTTDEQKRTLGERDAELGEVRQALDDARAAIEERARWLATREASIAELKATLDQERAGRAEALKGAEGGKKEMAEAAARIEALVAEVAARDKKLAEASTTSNALLLQERAKAEAVAARRMPTSSST